ncbi:MAG TPA: hypothetical protein VK631_18305 [Solirubrobacteraceae bacterium]|nr:hypothetical protein [Solirubrobacteraceae bacterium]
MTEFDADARARFAALADALIPAGEGMPSASEAGVAGEWLDAVLAAEPGFGPPLVALLAGADVADVAGELRRIETTDPGGWGTLTTVVAGAYFLNPSIAERVGYPGRRAIPVDVDASPDWLEDGLLDSVRSRGPIYRPTP